LDTTWITPKMAPKDFAIENFGAELTHEYSLTELLKRPTVNMQNIQACIELNNIQNINMNTMNNNLGHELATSVVEQVETIVKYSGYINKQKQEIDKINSSEKTKIPSDFDYESVPALSNEVKEKLSKIRPETLGQASRISGIPQSAITLIMIYLKKSGAKFN
jgi:tRNA uridine 5-carboxymethylaminomethyl modification enzyme